MNFEMDVEVRPQFDVPQLRGARSQTSGRRAYRTSTSTSSSRAFSKATARSCPNWKGPPNIGDYLTADLAFMRPDGKP